MPLTGSTESEAPESLFQYLEDWFQIPGDSLGPLELSHLNWVSLKGSVTLHVHESAECMSVCVCICECACQ